MANAARAARIDLEALLRARKLDNTLTSALPSPGLLDEQMVVPTGIAVLDERLHGGVPRGQVSEIVGPRSSGRVSLLVAMLAGATARGEIAALVDTLDMFDAASAAAGGIDLARLLWIRGQGQGPDVVERRGFAAGGRGPTGGSRDQWTIAGVAVVTGHLARRPGTAPAGCVTDGRVAERRGSAPSIARSRR